MKDKKIDVALTVQLLRILVGFAMCISVPVFSLSSPYSLVLMISGGLIAGADLLLEGIKGFLREEYFTRNTVLLIVFVVSYIVGVGYEGSLLLILTQFGIALSKQVRTMVRNHVLTMTGLNFKTAHVYRGGLVVENYLEELFVGDEILVRAGEYFPVDCVITEGSSTVSAGLLDLKCREFAVNIGDEVYAGCLNMGGDVRCEVIREQGSTATDILEMLKNPIHVEKPLYDRYFQPMMFVFAVLVGVMVAVLADVDAYEAVHRGLAVLTLSSAVPAYAGFADIRFAARAGVAARGCVFATDDVFAKLVKSDTALVCADGILTEGKLRVTAAFSELYDEDTFLCIGAHAMAYASDPAAEAILEAYNGDIVFEHIRDFREIPNCGVMINYRGTPVVLGTQALMASVKGLLPKKLSADRQMMFMLVGKQYAGYFVLTDPISDSCGEIFTQMNGYGITNGAFVTSYSGETAEKIAAQTGVETFAYGFSCDERAQYVEQLAEESAGSMAYFCSKKYAAEEHSAADIDVYVGGSTVDLTAGRAEVIATMGRTSAILEGMRDACATVKMCNSAALLIFAVKLLLIVLAGAGLITVWFAACFELIATLFVKIYSASAYEEKTLGRHIKSSEFKKEKA